MTTPQAGAEMTEDGCCKLCGDQMDTPPEYEPTEICHQCAHKEVDRLNADLTAARLDIERHVQAAIERDELHRMQLVAISTVSTCNTYGSLAQHRVEKSNPYWTPSSYQDVFEAIEREIKERVSKEAAEGELAAMRLNAERYRVLRNIGPWTSELAVLEVGDVPDDTVMLTGEQLDAHIDTYRDAARTP